MITIIVVITVIAAISAGYAVVARKNYTDNAAAENRLPTMSRMVNDQNGLTGKLFRYGLYPAKHNACEAIAVHNVKVLLGRESRLTDVIRRFQRNIAMIGYGFFGSNVYMIGTALKREGIPYKRVKLKELDENGIYIVCFWNRGAPWHGIHTVTAVNDGKRWHDYNLHGDGVVSSESPFSFASNYICGYRITEKDEQNN